jgi:hypothetical protein
MYWCFNFVFTSFDAQLVSEMEGLWLRSYLIYLTYSMPAVMLLQPILLKEPHNTAVEIPVKKLKSNDKITWCRQKYRPDYPSRKALLITWLQQDYYKARAAAVCSPY